MALKKPLAQYGGKYKELATTDTIISMSVTTDADSGAILSTVVKQISVLSGYGVAAGTNTYTVSIAEVVSLAAGLGVTIKFTNANTGASTIAINSLGVINIYKATSTALAAGDIAAGSMQYLTYDGTNFQVSLGAALPATPSKVITTNSSGVLQAVNDLVDSISTTTDATLMGLDWTSGSVTATGSAGQKVFGASYEFTCTGTNTWKRSPYNLIINDLYLAVVTDATVKTSTQMAALYPAAVQGNRVRGNTGVYEYFGTTGWWYFAKTS